MKNVKTHSFHILLVTTCLFSCTNTKTVNSFIFYKVSDKCLKMGYIEGNVRQAPIVGDYTTSVTAIPNEGYVFVEWDDGLKEAERSDLSTDGFFIIYTASFEKIND